MATSKKKKAAKRAQGGPKRAAKSKAASKKAAAGEDRLHTSQVRDLVRLMVDNDLSTLEIVNGDLKVSLGRGLQAASSETAPTPAPAAPAPTPAAGEPSQPPPAQTETLLDVVSPMVGTFYAFPSPDSEPYVTVGDQVTADTVVCIVEAMKVMNEIKAECSGQIVDVAVANGQPVEYGQVLFRVKP
ncbi:MAG: acetyl-CoA carboxylase biotin carboxyl carrier protein [Planctomycetota bacterium]